MFLLSVTVVILSLTGTARSGQAAAAETTRIRAEGATVLALVEKGKTVASVTLTAVRLKRGDRNFPDGSAFEGVDELSVLRAVRILVGTDEVFVWRSVFVDLTDPVEASIRRTGRTFRLTINGRDGADAFQADIYFDSMKVTRRVIYHPLYPKEVTEDTRYRLR